MTGRGNTGRRRAIVYRLTASWERSHENIAAGRRGTDRSRKHRSAQGYWVTGNRASGKCEIVTSNPVVNGQVGGNVTFGSGPYRSDDDAKLARSTIRECPPEPPGEARDADKADKND